MKALESKTLDSEEISAVFEGKLAENKTLITDKHRSNKKFTRGNDKLIHRSVLAKGHVDNQNRTSTFNT